MKFQWTEEDKNTSQIYHVNDLLSYLALLHLYRDIDITVEDIVDEFVKCHPRRLQLVDVNCKIVIKLSFKYLSHLSVTS